MFQVQLGPIHAAVSVHGPKLLGPTKYEYSTAELEMQVDEASTLTALPEVAAPVGAVVTETAEHAEGAEGARETVVWA